MLPLAICIFLWVDQRRMVVAREQRGFELERIGVENEAVRTLSDGAARELTEAAAREAMAEQEHLQERKLREVRESAAYKLWKVSLEVQQGYNMTQRAKDLLARGSMSAAEKGQDDYISDAIFARQLMAAGAALVERTFPEYKELGGEAASPGAVIPGPDPFANYRTVQDGASRRARFGPVRDYADDSPFRPPHSPAPPDARPVFRVAR